MGVIENLHMQDETINTSETQHQQLCPGFAAGGQDAARVLGGESGQRLRRLRGRVCAGTRLPRHRGRRDRKQFRPRLGAGTDQGFVADPAATHPPGIRRIQEWLRPLQTAWHSGVAWDRLPWFAEDKARSGAFATFLGFQMLATEGTGEGQGTGNREQGTAIEIEAPPPMESHLAISFLGAAQTALGDNLIDIAGDEEGAFVAFAIGDSCLFQIRDDALELAFPLSHSSQFDSRPILLCSNDSNNKQVWDDITLERGTLQPGDTLLFATDALARWFLAQCETGAKPWEILLALQSQAEFDALTAGLRRSRAMRNDDVTLIVVEPISASLVTEADTAVALPENGAEGILPDVAAASAMAQFLLRPRTWLARDTKPTRLAHAARPLWTEATHELAAGLGLSGRRAEPLAVLRGRAA